MSAQKGTITSGLFFLTMILKHCKKKKIKFHTAFESFYAFSHPDNHHLWSCVYFMYLFLMRCLTLDIIQLLLSAKSLLSPYYQMWGIVVEGDLKGTTQYLLSLMTGFFILQELKKRSNVKLSAGRRQPQRQHQSVVGSNSYPEPGSSPFPPTPALQLVLSILPHRFPSLPSSTSESQTASCRGTRVGAVSPLGPGCTSLIEVLGKILF